MGMPCKEEIYLLEKIRDKQEQIFPDACDIGIRIDDGRNIDVRQDVRNIIKAMACCQEKKIEYKFGMKWSFWSPIEMDDGKEHGMSVVIGWHKPKYKKIEYLSISINREIR